jgi:hypothetical protein
MTTASSRAACAVRPALPWRAVSFAAALLGTAASAYAASQTVTLTPTADAYVRDGSPTTNFGSDATLVVKDGASTFERHALLKFDLSSINGLVTSVKLKLNVASKEGGSTAIPIRLHPTTDGWTETGVTWNNQPTAGTAITSIDITASGPREYANNASLDSYVAAELAGDKIVSFVLTGDGVNYGVTFDSRTGTTSPVLEVTYDAAETHTLIAVEDAYVRSGTVSPNNHENTNYGTATTLEIKNGDPGFNRRALFKFNTGTLTGQVIRARLRVYVSSRESGATIPVNVAEIADSWNESAASPLVTWANQPTAGTSVGSKSIPDDGWEDIDITPSFVDLQVAGDRTVSVMMTDTTNPATATPKTLQLHSRENTNKPQLVIDIVPAPVTLQSTTLNAYRDTYARSNATSTTHGTSTTLVVKGQSGAIHETYVRFNLATIYGSVQEAFLKLYATTKGTGNFSVDVYGVSDDTWYEVTRTIDSRTFSGLTWNNKPAQGTLLGTITVDGINKYVGVNVTSYLADQNARGDKFASFALRTTSGDSTGVVFSSREGANAPQLDIEWQPGLMAFPEAVGPGGASRGAYTTTASPEIRRVTNRNDAGTGSFREAVAGSTPAIVIFDVGGVFSIKSEVRIGSYKTIIGESAPEPVTFRSLPGAQRDLDGDGILNGVDTDMDGDGVANSSDSDDDGDGTTDSKDRNPWDDDPCRVAIHGSHVVVTGLRLRPGMPVDEQAIFVTRSETGPMRTDIIVAYCSLTWTSDELAGGWGGVQRLTYQDCIMGEGLDPAEVSPNDSETNNTNNKGFYVGSNYEDVEDVAFVRNFFTTVKMRFVGFKRAGSVIVAENLLYNWGSGDGAMIVYDNNPFGNTRMDIMNNVLVAGPWTGSFDERTFRLDQAGKYYLSGNKTPVGDNVTYPTNPDPSWIASQRVFGGSYTPSLSGKTALETALFSRAGARFAGALDSIDTRMITQYNNNSATSTGPAEGQDHTFFDDYEPTIGATARADTPYNGGTNPDGIYDAYETQVGATVGSINPHTVITANDGLGSQWVGYTRIEHQRHWLRTGSLQ